MRAALFVLTLLTFSSTLLAAPDKALQAALAQVDGARMKATVEKLVTFGTRHTLSDTTSEKRGIGAARKWIFDEMSRYAAQSDGHMTVAYQRSMQQSARTGDKPVEITNVVATIKGTSDPTRVYIVTGHYDSRNTDINDATGDAPGADDDASGVAVVMELARILSKMPQRATIVLAPVAGEEQGLLGSKGLSEFAEAQGWNVEGMITNDIVGGVEGGSGAVDNHTIRIFAGTTKPIGESAARHWGRYVRDVVRENLPQVKPRLVYRVDRFGRGGDHIPFYQKGLPAIRFTEAHENYRRQHQNVRMENGVQYGDLPQYVSADYMALVASVNLATVYSAAAAPAAPRDVKVAGAVTDDTTLTWAAAGDDVAGYELVMRETTADEWERVFDIGKVASYTMKGVPIDNYFFGIRAYDAAGHRSPVRTPEEK